MLKGKIDRSQAIEINGRIIKANMKRLGIKAADIASHLNISPSSLSQTLKTDISLSWLKTIADFSGCSVNDLVYEHTEQEDKIAGFIKIGKEICEITCADDILKIAEELITVHNKSNEQV